MRKIWISIFVCILLCGLALCAMAAPEGPQITMQPQNYVYDVENVAIYTVKASGSNLTATWYMQWQGEEYTISDIGGAMQPWEPYAGENYGAKKNDDNTFSFVFEGIGEELNGAYIWCVIEDGHYDVTSQKALISVSGDYAPPVILQMPAAVTAAQGEAAEIRCVAQTPYEDTQLTYLWYETATGNLQDIIAINRGTEDSDFLICDTSTVGTRYYVCMVQTTEGGTAYSSVVPVTVTEKQQNVTPPETDPTEPEIPTQPETQAPTAAPEESAPAPQTTAPAETEETAGSDKDAGKQENGNGIEWWIVALVAVVCACAGVGIALLILKKKK